MKKQTILIIDDDNAVRFYCKEFLKTYNYNIIDAPSGILGLKLFEEYNPDLVIVDLIMPDMDGFKVMEKIKIKNSIVPIIVISGDAEIKNPIEALKLGAWDYILKPITDYKILLHTIKRGIENYFIKLENIKYKESLEKLVQQRTKELETTHKILVRSEERYRRIYENLNDTYFEIFLDGLIFEINNSVTTLTGYQINEMLNNNISILFEDKTQFNNFIDHFQNNYILQNYEAKIKTKNGNSVFCLITAKLIKSDGFSNTKICGTIRDITSIKETEEKVKKQLQEKEILIQEIHHRVKNNMEIINSLIYLQGEYIEDEMAKEHLNELKNRIQAMALVHNQLYMSESLSQIHINNYINKLINNIIASYSSDVKYLGEIENFRITIEFAIPMGLIINEIVTNSIKYAFNDDDKEKLIKVTCKKIDKKTVYLNVFDNGKGFDDKENIADSLGMTLISSLIRQLDGTYKRYSNPGLCYEMTLKLN